MGQNRALRHCWLLLGVLGSLASPARAACVSEGVQLFPAPGATIPTNSRFILEGLGSDQKRVQSLVGKTLELRSGRETVPVKVTRGWRSEMSRVAVLLKPTRLLKPGTEYRLVINGPLENIRFVTPMPQGVSWHTGHGADLEKPRWQENPSVSEGEYSLRDRELSRHITLHLVVKEASPAFVVVTMRRLRGAVGIQTYFAPINGDQAEFGHDGCQGSFTFEDGGAYRARVELVDAAGNSGPSAEVEFLSPTPNSP